MRACFSLLLLSLLHLSFAKTDPEEKYPQDYFRSPLPQQTLLLAGTFGELRPNHFHAGIDIKATVGTPILAAAEGYLAKIEISGNGYGKALYIAHPNGYTTLYAHMDRFTPEVDAFVKKVQYESKQFEQEIELKPNQFIVEKGDQIGRVGLTGATLGPHLHFEIHDTESEDPINPLLFGFNVHDNRAPILQELKVYHLNQQHQAVQEKTFSLIKSNGIYGFKGDTVSISTTEVGFAVKGYDPMDNVHNQNGIYVLSVFQDDSLVYRFRMETFPEEDTRYLNAHLDYSEQINRNGYFYRCYVLPYNKLPIYLHKPNNGVVHLREGQTSEIKILAEDYHGNTSTTRFFVKRDSLEIRNLETGNPEIDYQYIIPHYEESIIQDRDLELFFPVGVFYEDLHLKYEAMESETTPYSLVYQINDRNVPVHDYFNIGIRPKNLPDHLKNKAFIAYRARTNCGSEWRADMLHASVRYLGDYRIMVDTIAPSISPVTFKSYMRGYKRMIFKIGDNFDTASNMPGLQYEATVDGQWILLEYDAKSRTIAHTFDGTIKIGKHLLEITVREVMGNEKVYKRYFTL
ncbi:MAG: M23 family metallopeptidase [Saprospiraceae bacterium]|nr:M23 family metallopeptidase [Saprospiraceae bacterium]